MAYISKYGGILSRYGDVLTRLDNSQHSEGFIPSMTSNSAPYPFIASYSSNYSSQSGYAYNAFDGNDGSAINSNFWCTSFSIKIEFLSPIPIWRFSYKIRPWSAGSGIFVYMRLKDGDGNILGGPWNMGRSSTDLSGYYDVTTTPFSSYILDFYPFDYGGFAVRVYTFQIYSAL